jgi:hypothetical protein
MREVTNMATMRYKYDKGRGSVLKIFIQMMMMMIMMIMMVMIIIIMIPTNISAGRVTKIFVIAKFLFLSGNTERKSQNI